jgi:hypothetical protein
MIAFFDTSIPMPSLSGALPLDTAFQEEINLRYVPFQLRVLTQGTHQEAAYCEQLCADVKPEFPCNVP